MTFKELLDQYTWEEIAPVLHLCYPGETLEGYKEALDELRSLTPKPSQMAIGLEWILDEDGDYVNVYGIEDETRYGLDFVYWTEWLSLSILKETLAAFSPREILVHCLYEMTFYGFSNEKIMEEREKLFAIVKEIKEK